ncbi:hypothetical protein BC351_38710 [Paenibacillus ferrarius]|uniref:Uncharacterized protein n=1 Tax=Paenibacillus ferrarius TaxID=1469647 RepID=A0A1V4H9S4_9BACL|nr:hypothetical protein [Paenibacillus ferrarius]OPH48112.1 hypothetical protein BC351_38710 [Paenibacillus ferrarius]
MQIDKIQEKKDKSPNEVEFIVTFIDKEGKPFKVRSKDKETSIFRYSVKKISGSFKVTNLPPYQA